MKKFRLPLGLRFNTDILKHFGFVAIIIFFISYNFFYIGNYAAYPWFHEVINDGDGTYSAQAVSILNGNETEYMHHPGATVCALHGYGYQLLGIFSEPHAQLLKLDQVKDYNEAYHILGIATRTSRAFALLTLIFFSIVFYAVAFQLTNHALLSALITFFIFISNTLLFHSYAVRPELLNILFFFIALFLTIKVLREIPFSTKKNYLYIILIGICVGYSIFAKVQIFPALVCFFGCLMFYLFRFLRIESAAVQKTIKLSFIISLGNILLMPWWVTKKPSLLTTEYLKNASFTINNHQYGPYGSAPENIALPVLGLLFALMLISLLCFYYSKKSIQNALLARIIPSSLFFNLITLGFILSIYLVYLPVFNFSNYFKNTNHLFYAVVSNIFYGNGFLMNDNFTFLSALNETIGVHSIRIQFFSINLFYISGLISTISIVQFFLRKQNKDYMFLLVIAFFITGFLMDFASMLRAPYMMGQYIMYSRIFYGISFILWIYLQFIKYSFYSKKVNFVLLYLIIGFFLFNVLIVSIKFYESPHADGITTFKQDKIDMEIGITKSYVAPFWATIDKAVLKGQEKSIYLLKKNLTAYFDQRKKVANLSPLNKIDNRAFKKGEVLKYRIHYGLIDAGDAILEVKNEVVKQLGNRNIYRIVGTVESNGAFDLFFKVRDRFESYIDQDAMVPWAFIRRCQEGNTKIDHSTFFDRNYNKVISDKGVYESITPVNIQDIISTYYYIRCMDFSNVKIGKTDSLTAFFDDELLNFSLKYLGKEIITTSLGTFSCLKLCPVLPSGKQFNKEGNLLLWITDDENKILIRGQANIFVGSIKIDLTQYSGLANDFSMQKNN